MRHRPGTRRCASLCSSGRQGSNGKVQEVLSELEKAPKEETAVHTLVSEYRRRLKPDPVAIGLWVLTLCVFCFLTYFRDQIKLSALGVALALSTQLMQRVRLDTSRAGKYFAESRVLFHRMKDEVETDRGGLDSTVAHEPEVGRESYADSL